MTIDDGGVSDDKKGRHVDPDSEPEPGPEPDPEPDSFVEIGIGAGIAIAGIWIASVSLSVFMVLLFLVWIPGSTETISSLLNLFDIALTSCVAFVPIIVAWATTKAIIYRDNK